MVDSAPYCGLGDTVTYNDRSWVVSATWKHGFGVDLDSLDSNDFCTADARDLVVTVDLSVPPWER